MTQANKIIIFSLEAYYQDREIFVDKRSEGEFLLLDSLNDTIRRHIANNAWIYLIIVFVFIIGISLGSLTVNNIDEVTKTDARAYLEGFLNLTSENELQSSSILKQSIKFNLYFSLLLFFSGLLFAGILFIPIIVAFRGYCIGFSIAFLTDSFGANGFLLSLCSILPQNFIYVPVTIVTGAIGLNYSLWALRNKFFKRLGPSPNLFVTYAFSSFVLLIFFIAGSIVEAYITSLIVKIFIPYIT